VPQIDVEQWWQTQNDARRAQVAEIAAAPSKVRDVREHEIGVLKAAHLTNRNGIRTSLFRLMPYLREVLPEASTQAAAAADKSGGPSIPVTEGAPA
jgi:type IV secretion system protein VirD4